MPISPPYRFFLALFFMAAFGYNGSSLYGYHGTSFTATAQAGSVTPSVPSTGILNGAGFDSVVAGLSPGAIASIFGTNLSDAPASGVQPGLVPGTNMLNVISHGTQVTFDAVAAPLLFVSPTQLNVQVPLEVTGKTAVQVVVSLYGQASLPVTVPILPATPALFTINSSGKGRAVALNQDGSLNAAGNWAAADSVIQLYATGLGAVSPPPTTGLLAHPFPPPALSVDLPIVTIGGVPAIVEFSGLAPGFVGLWQVNVRVPSGVGVGELLLSAGGQIANPVTVFIKEAYITSGPTFIQDVNNPTLRGFVEVSVWMDLKTAGQCDMWGRNWTKGPFELWRTTANNANCDNWTAPTSVLTVPGGILYPYVFINGSTYYLLAVVVTRSDVLTGDIFMWSSPDGITWSILNNGNAVLKHDPIPSHWGNVLYNPAAVFVGSTIYFFIEATTANGDVCNVVMGIATSTLAAGPNFNSNLTELTPVLARTGNPYVAYDSTDNALILLFGDFAACDYWVLGAATGSLADNLLDPTKWHRSQNFIYGKWGHHVTDPHMLVTTGKSYNLMLFYLYDQISTYDAYQLFSNMTLSQFYKVLWDR